MSVALHLCLLFHFFHFFNFFWKVLVAAVMLTSVSMDLSLSLYLSFLNNYLSFFSTL